MIEFSRIWVFLLLPSPWLARYLLSAVPASASVIVPDSISAHFAAFDQGPAAQRFRWQDLSWFRVLGWVALLTALAGPHTKGPDLLRQTGRDMMIAIDLSASMAADDMMQEGQRTVRLDSARNTIEGFLAQRKGDRIGLIGFAREAYLIAPLTFDTDAIARYLRELSIGLPGRKTDLGKAIGLTVLALQNEPAGIRVLILLSDGENNSGPLNSKDAAKLAAANGIRIYPVGFSASFSETANQAMDQIAQTTGGRVFRATTPEELDQIYQDIDEIEAVTVKARKVQLQHNWDWVALVVALFSLVFVSIAEWKKQ